MTRTYLEVHFKNIRMILLRMPRDEFCQNDIESFTIYKDISEELSVKFGNIMQKKSLDTTLTPY